MKPVSFHTRTHHWTQRCASTHNKASGGKYLPKYNYDWRQMAWQKLTPPLTNVDLNQGWGTRGLKATCGLLGP
jgi:hypothetical protein